MELSGGLNLRQGARTLAHWMFLFLLPFSFFFPNQFLVHFPHESKGWRTKCLLYMTLKDSAEQENIQLDIYKTVEH